MTTKTRSESALVRPYTNLAPADLPLDAVKLLVDGVEHPPGTVVMPTDKLNAAHFSIRLPEPDVVRKAVEQTSVPMVDCGLVVLATAITHRASCVLLAEHLRVASYGDELMIDRTLDPLVLRDANGFDLTVAVVLLNDLAPRPLQPFMAGTWLARRDFDVRPEVDDNAFSPEALTKETREFYGLPEAAMRYVHVDGVLEEDELSEAVKVYVDSDILTLLLASPTDPAALQMQVDLAVQATEIVAGSIVRELSGTGVEPSPENLAAYPAADRFVQRLATRLELTVADVLNLASNPAEIRAHLEAAFDLRAATLVALKGA